MGKKFGDRLKKLGHSVKFNDLRDEVAGVIQAMQEKATTIHTSEAIDLMTHARAQERTVRDANNSSETIENAARTIKDTLAPQMHALLQAHHTLKQTVEPAPQHPTTTNDDAVLYDNHGDDDTDCKKDASVEPTQSAVATAVIHTTIAQAIPTRDEALENMRIAMQVMQLQIAELTQQRMAEQALQQQTLAALAFRSPTAANDVAQETQEHTKKLSPRN